MNCAQTDAQYGFLNHLSEKAAYQNKWGGDLLKIYTPRAHFLNLHDK